MLWKKIFILAFTFYGVDVRKLKNHRQNFFSLPALVEMTREETNKQEKKKTRLFQNKKWKQRQKYRNKKLKYTSTKSLDHRFSNQRRLRRMYRNS